MKQGTRSALIISLGVLMVFNITSAQDESISPEILEQYQQQLNNARNNSSYQQSQPAADQTSPAFEPKKGSASAQGLPTEETNLAPSNEALRETGVSAQELEISPESSTAPQIASPVQVQNYNSPSLILYYASATAIIFVLFWLGWWRKLFKRKKKPGLPSEAEKGTVPCPACGGGGKIAKKRKAYADCKHCKGKGIDICHHCSGTGRCGLGLVVPETEEEVENFMKCDYCGGKGFPELVLPCCMCKGKRKLEYEESYEETCPTCKGSGQVIK